MCSHFDSEPVARLRSLRLLAAAVLLVTVLGAACRVEAAPAPPALYTPAQALAGQVVFEAHCATCHGDRLEGRSGPALEGETFASPAARYTVRDIFQILSVNMPAYAPGSLTERQYVEVMAFLLQRNGYPAGRVELTAQIAGGSTVPLLYHGPRPSRARGASGSAGAARSALPGEPASHTSLRTPPRGQRSGTPPAASLLDVATRQGSAPSARSPGN